MTFSNFTFAQDTLYFDAKWNPSTFENAKFYRVESKNGDTFLRQDFFIKNNQLQMKSTLTSLEPEIKEGEIIYYHENGKIKSTGTYIENIKEGEFWWYYQDGTYEALETYENGVLNGAYKEYYENGKLYSEANFKNGLQDGKTIYFHENGKKQSEGIFVNGERLGEWLFYNENGKLIGKQDFKKEHFIEEAELTIKFPSTKWQLAAYNQGNLTEYIFKREEIEDANGRQIIPAVMVYIEDASNFDDLILFSAYKQRNFIAKGVKIEEVLTYETENSPLKYKNALLYKCSYNIGEEHVFYMTHLMTKSKKGVQILLDMTKSIAADYEKEFEEILASIEIK